jgi:cellulose synthase/poly-beta-1,6-N-acetylglucosamine synthase-like glycosyltransferase/peptidoglycan/xylan/chitin deacetylase (PgdA/CDA1 family)
VILLALSSALVVHGYAHHEVGHTETRPNEARQSAGLEVPGALLDLRGEQPRATEAPERTVALTFDDGPDDRWTPEILEVLERHGVRATFFVVGSRVLEHPDLVRRLRREGHEIGVHTFSHVDTGRMSGWEGDLQLSLAQTALAGVTGTRAVLYRPPYSSSPAGVSIQDYETYRDVAGHGYLIALADFDSRDWQADGVDAIVARAMPPRDAGGIVLFHDGGGDRAETVAAVDRLLTSLEDRDYEFVTIGELAGLPSASVQPPAGRADRLQGWLLRGVLATGELVAGTLSILLPILGLLAVSRVVALVFLARRHARRPERRAFDPSFIPSVTIVVPAFNEAAGIEAAVRSLAGSDYPDVDVLVVDDGSTDDTAELVRRLGLANVRVVSQPNQGKAAALNTGIAEARGELVVMVDGDTIFEPETLGYLVQPFTDPAVGAVAGNTKVANRRGLLGRWQHIEYVMGFNLDRRMYEELRCMPTVPGAIGAFRRRALEQLGGVGTDTLAEDTDLTMAIGRAGWHVVYEQRARAWTEAPTTWRMLWKQRYRWSYGTMQAMWKHRGVVRPSARSPLGRRALPYLFTFHVLLPIVAPVIDLYAIYGLLFLDRAPVVAFWLGFSALQLLVARAAFRLDGERTRVLWALPVQQFVHRQFMYLVVIQSAVTAVLGAPLRWHEQSRSGDFSAAPGQGTASATSS